MYGVCNSTPLHAYIVSFACISIYSRSSSSTNASSSQHQAPWPSAASPLSAARHATPYYHRDEKARNTHAPSPHPPHASQTDSHSRTFHQAAPPPSAGSPAAPGHDPHTRGRPDRRARNTCPYALLARGRGSGPGRIHVVPCAQGARDARRARSC